MSSDLSYEVSDESSENELLERSLSVWRGWGNMEWEDFTPIALDIHTACSIGQYDWVRSIINRNEGIALDRKNQGGWTPLMYACYIGHDNIVSLLIHAGCNMNIKNPRGHTPLMLAASCGNESVARTLVRNQADLKLMDKAGWTALFHATYAGHQNFVAFLLEAGTDMDATEPSTGLTPFMVAAAEGHEIIVQYFLQHGVNIHAKAYNGDVARSLALINGYTKIVSLIDNHVMALGCLRSEPGLDSYLSSSDEVRPHRRQPSHRSVRGKTQGPSIRDGPEAIARMIDRTHNADAVPDFRYVTFPAAGEQRETTQLSYRDVTSPINPDDYGDSSGCTDAEDDNEDSSAFTKTGAITIKSSSSSSGGLAAALGLSREGSIDDSEDSSHSCEHQRGHSWSDEDSPIVGGVSTPWANDDPSQSILSKRESDTGGASPLCAENLTSETTPGELLRLGMEDGEVPNVPVCGVEEASGQGKAYSHPTLTTSQLLDGENTRKEASAALLSGESDDAVPVSPLRNYFPVEVAFPVSFDTAQPNSSNSQGKSSHHSVRDGRTVDPCIPLPKDNMTQTEIVNRFLRNLTLDSPEKGSSVCNQDRFWEDENVSLARCVADEAVSTSATHDQGIVSDFTDGVGQSLLSLKNLSLESGSEWDKPVAVLSPFLFSQQHQVSVGDGASNLANKLATLSGTKCNVADVQELLAPSANASSFPQQTNQPPRNFHPELNHHHPLHNRHSHNRQTHNPIPMFSSENPTSVRNTLPVGQTDNDVRNHQSFPSAPDPSGPHIMSYLPHIPQQYFYQDVNVAGQIQESPQSMSVGLFGTRHVAPSGSLVRQHTAGQPDPIPSMSDSLFNLVNPFPSSELPSKHSSEASPKVVQPTLARGSSIHLHGSGLPLDLTQADTTSTQCVAGYIDNNDETHPQLPLPQKSYRLPSHTPQPIPPSSVDTAVPPRPLLAAVAESPASSPTAIMTSGVRVIIPGHSTSQPVVSSAIGWLDQGVAHHGGPQDLAEMLTQLGLARYLGKFEEQDVDLQVFLSLTDHDLKMLGIKLFGPRKKMTNAIARWHSKAPICGASLEQAYADKLEGEMQEMAIQLNQVYEKEEHMKAQVLQEQQLRSVTESCLMEERSSWEQARQLLQDVRGKLRTMGELMSKLRHHQEELKGELLSSGVPEVPKCVRDFQAEDWTNNPGPAPRNIAGQCEAMDAFTTRYPPEARHDGSQLMPDDAKATVASQGIHPSMTQDRRSSQNFACEELLRKSDKYLNELQQVFSSLVLSTGHILKSTHGIDGQDKDMT